jgi:phthalate 4,5-cis-dihydrodiol dehydrogenase
MTGRVGLSRRELMARKLGIGAAGLGRGFTVMVPTLACDPRLSLVAAADLRPEARSRFASDFGAKTYDTVEALCADAAVELVYVATPHQCHVAHAVLAAQAGKHVLVEKPMALSITECQTMIDAARQAKVQLIVGHSHSFDAPVARARRLIERGDYGSPRMITALNFTDFVYRPRRPEEFDTARGGGVIFSQAAHQVDVVRLLAGTRARRVRAVTGAWDERRPMDGAYAALLLFENDMPASLTYSGYGHFDSDEWQGLIGEMGQKKEPRQRDRRAFATPTEEGDYKQSRNYGGANYSPSSAPPRAHQSFGTVIVSCERADLRPMPNGVMIYKDGAGELDPLPPPAIPRVEVIDEVYDAVVKGVRPKHDGAWAMATLEICLAMLRSNRDGCEIELEHQV